MRNSSAYRQYNSHLPRWLHNRPRQFITHCCQRLTHAQSITKEDISQEGDGQFLVKSQSDNKISYQVHFGDCSNMPSCTFLTGKDITGYASILWLSTSIFQKGDGKQCLLPTVQAPTSRLI